MEGEAPPEPYVWFRMEGEPPCEPIQVNVEVKGGANYPILRDLR